MLKLFKKKLNHIHKFYGCDKNNWTAIVCMWKRDGYIIEQIEAIESQTIKPKEIIILKNENHIKIPREIHNKKIVKLIECELNNLYFRWLVPYIVNTKYVCIFDDDVIPGRRWIENCFRVSEENDLLIGATGRIYNKKRTPPWVNVNPINGERFIVCDWVCNSYFFKCEWVQYIVQWQRYMNSTDTLDDIHLAQSLKHNGDIRSAVLVQPNDDEERSGNLKKIYGRDENALWLRPEYKHQNKRSDYVRIFFGFKWKLLSKVTSFLRQF